MSDSLSYSKTATPLFVAGAPRSGTTFLTASLNTHPQIVITNELRIWTVFNDTRKRTARVSQILPEHPLREEFRRELNRAYSRMFREFYRKHVNKTNLGCPASSGTSVEQEIRAYGDKNPGYADTHDPGCVTFIAKALPGSKFVHIYRDPRSCVASYKALPVYSDDIRRCVNTWLRHTRTMAELRDKLGPKRVLEIPYDRYVTEEGDAIFQQLEEFVGVDHATEPLSFLRRERAAPVPYRSPTTPSGNLGKRTYETRLTAEEIEIVERQCAPLMERYGFTAAQAAS